MRTLQVSGIIISRRDHGEKDLLLDIFTLERGRIRIIVRGTKKPSSTLRRAAELFNEGIFTIIPRRTFSLLEHWEPIETFEPIKHDLEKLSLGFYLLRMLNELTREEDPEPKLYFLLKNLLLLIQNTKHCCIIKTIYDIGFLEVSGYSLSWQECRGCGKPVKSNCYLNISAGGLVCTECDRSITEKDNLPLSLESVKIGKKFAKIVSDVLCTPIQTDEMKVRYLKMFTKLFDKLTRYEKDIRILNRAMHRFYQYHLNSDIRQWYIPL